MKENIEKAIEWAKSQEVKGCITGSIMLEYFEGSDLDIFIYDEKSFTKLLYAMHYSEDFAILDKLEQWKFDQYMNKNQDNFYKFGLVTIKFYYNTCVEVNVILKKNCKNIFSVLSSFDMDIISKGYDIETKQYLDLSGDSSHTKIASWNKWNTAYYNPEIWEISRILRQLERCFKYYNRGYNTDAVVKKYIEFIDHIQDFNSIFNSDSYNEKLRIKRSNTLIIKKICQTWLDTHSVTEEEINLIKEKIKEI